MAQRALRQFRAALSDDELRQINADAAVRGIDRAAWFTLALRESKSWRRVFPEREGEKKR